MKSPLSLLILFILCCRSGCASALNLFECLRDLLPVTEMAFLTKQRHGQEHPFLIGKFMVIPETAQGRVSGFYIYGEHSAGYFKTVSEVDGSKPRALNSLAKGVRYRLMVQPETLEVLTIDFEAGYKPFAAKEVYSVPEHDENAPLLRLQRSPESEDSSLKPLLTELRLRETWIQNNNVDLEDFKKLNQVMQTTCRSSADAAKSSPALPQK